MTKKILTGAALRDWDTAETKAVSRGSRTISHERQDC